MKGRPDGSPTAVDVVLRPEWAAIEGTDNVVQAFDVNLAANGFCAVAYTPAAGRLLVITNLTGELYAVNVADRGQPVVMSAGIQVGLAYPVLVGGYGGVVVPLTKPIQVPGGTQVTISGTNRSGVVCNAVITGYGYEMDV